MISSPLECEQKTDVQQRMHHFSKTLAFHFLFFPFMGPTCSHGVGEPGKDHLPWGVNYVMEESHLLILHPSLASEL